MWKTASLLLGAVAVLMTTGVVILTSTSQQYALDTYDDAYFFLKRQIIWILLSVIAAVFTSKVDYRLWRKFVLPLAAFIVILLIMTLIPGVGLDIKGSRRWLRFGPMNLQSSELAKPVFIFLMAWWYSRYPRHLKNFPIGVLVPGLMMGVFLGLIILEPDFGTTMLLAVVGGGIMFVAGVKVIYLLLGGLGGAGAFVVLIMNNEVRMKRVLAFLHPEEHAEGAGYQLLQAVYAFMTGGARGVGLGASMQKRLYLPEAHTDFIFAILGEELGLVATVMVVFLFFIILMCGMHIAMRAPDSFGRLTAFGITMLITMQAAINMGVVTGCLPTKGLALPFISFGGSCMVATLAMVGILFNIAGRAADTSEDDNLSLRDRHNTI